MSRYDEYRIRDPFILTAGGKYYMYESGTTEPSTWTRQIFVRVSDDLIHFSDRVPVFSPSGDFWADRDYWAPEVHQYGDAYYLFVSLKSETACRGTQIFRSESPMGPFTEWGTDGQGSYRPTTPAEWECLDGTLYVEGGVPYMVFCHEWLQVGDGEICAVRLTEDLRSPVGEPMLLFRASESGWAHTIREGQVCLITDGPFFRHLSRGALAMLWSSFHTEDGKRSYALGAAVSESGRLEGPWHHNHPLLFRKDGGHAMIFTDCGGKERLTLHQPNEGSRERAQIFDLQEKDGTLVITPAGL